jgi:hypothetical protein
LKFIRENYRNIFMMQIELSAVNGHTAIEQEGMIVKET